MSSCFNQNVKRCDPDCSLNDNAIHALYCITAYKFKLTLLTDPLCNASMYLEINSHSLIHRAWFENHYSATISLYLGKCVSIFLMYIVIDKFMITPLRAMQWIYS